MKRNLCASFVLFCLLMIPQESNAQFLKGLGKTLEKIGKEVITSCTISNESLRWDQTDQAGQRILQYYFDIDFYGMKGKNLQVMLAIEYPQGTYYRYANGQPMVYSGQPFRCNDDISSFKGQWLGIYVNALNPMPGRHTYYARIYVFDVDSKECIANSSYLTFDNEP